MFDCVITGEESFHKFLRPAAGICGNGVHTRGTLVMGMMELTRIDLNLCFFIVYDANFRRELTPTATVRN